MSKSAPLVHTRSAAFGAFLFLLFVFAGSSYVVWAKLAGLPGVQVTIVPLALMVLYALILALARYFRLRDDQAGDNLYYLGFLYTLTSLGVSLWQFSVNDGGEGIVTNFGIAIASTILGVALRVVFNQMRQDPVEVERTARLELADAARRIRQELDATTFEFASFRRATLQILEEGVVQTREHAERLVKEMTDSLKDFPERHIEAVNAASEQTEAAIQQLAQTASSVTASLEEILTRLKSLQTPDGIIEVKLQPFISGFTKAINAQAKATSDQTGELQSTISKFDDSVRQLAMHMTELAKNSSEDKQFLREFSTRLGGEAAESRRLLTELHKTLAAQQSSARPEGARWGQIFRGGSAT